MGKGGIAALVVAVALVGAAVATASPPIQVKKSDISQTFVDPDLSAACGTQVTITVSGNADATLWTNSAGLVVREIDTFPGAKVTYSGAGGSFSYEANLVLHFEYPQGATLGAPASATYTGLFGHVPGVIDSDAGREIVTGLTVVDFLGPIPLTDGGTATLDRGNRNSGDEIIAAICSTVA
jgi:hypothetical protein